jgi:hypothetical protein
MQECKVNHSGIVLRNSTWYKIKSEGAKQIVAPSIPKVKNEGGGREFSFRVRKRFLDIVDLL